MTRRMLKGAGVWALTMGLCMALIIGATAGLTLWIKERGVKVFEKL